MVIENPIAENNSSYEGRLSPSGDQLDKDITDDLDKTSNATDQNSKSIIYIYYSWYENEYFSYLYSYCLFIVVVR